jgi:hypothetical protein
MPQTDQALGKVVRLLEIKTSTLQLSLEAAEDLEAIPIRRVMGSILVEREALEVGWFCSVAKHLSFQVHWQLMDQTARTPLARRH